MPMKLFDAARPESRKSALRDIVAGVTLASMNIPQVLGYTRMHKGVDFAVPIGTPVMAAGAGTIQFMGRASGFVAQSACLGTGRGITGAGDHLGDAHPRRPHAGARQGRA